MQVFVYSDLTGNHMHTKPDYPHMIIMQTPEIPDFDPDDMSMTHKIVSENQAYHDTVRKAERLAVDHYDHQYLGAGMFLFKNKDDAMLFKLALS